MLAYLRGIGFHIGIFAGLGALFVSPWWSLLPVSVVWLLALLTGLGAIFGLIGENVKWTPLSRHNLGQK